MSNPPWAAGVLSPLLRPVLWLTVLIALFSAGAVAGFAQNATNLEIGTTVQQSGAKRFGIDLAGQNFYDSGQMLRNLIFMNPGFEGELWQSVLQCVAVTANTCQDADIYTVWPANFLQGATFEFISGGAKGETGTIASSTTASYQASYGITMTFSGPLSPAPAAGDWLIVRMQVPGNAQNGWWTSTSGGATLSTDTSDIAPDSPGKQALEMSASGSGQSASVDQAFDTTNGRSFVQLNGTYTLTFKAKGLGGNNQLNVSIARLATARGNENFLDQNVALTNQWQDYSYTFNAAEDGSEIGPVQVVFSVAGASIYLDDVALTEPAAADNPTPFRNAVVDRLRQLHPGIIRYMDSADFGTTIDNELAVPFAREPAGWGENQTEANIIPMGLHEFLTLCQAVGAEPWYSMPVGITPTEMQDLIQYLAGDASTPYGAIRAKLGQSAPWTSVFPVIHLELGNEVWNEGTFPGEAIDDPVVYGNRAAMIFAAARATPGYNPGRFDLVMDSQAVNSWWTSQEMANSSGYDSVDAAPYLFNTFDDDSSNEAIYGPMFAEPEMVDSTANGYMKQQAAAAASGKAPANLDVYEVNLSTTQGTAPQNTVTSVVGSLGAGLTLADHMFLMLRDDGIVNQNAYALTEYTNGYTNTATGTGGTMPLWGDVIDMGGETNANRPTFLAEQLANSAILPTMLQVTTTGANPTWNQPLSANDSVQLNGAHYLQSFAFTNGTQNSVVVFNLSRSGSLPITFSGANAPSGDVLVSQLTSANITDNNENLTSDTPVVHTTHTNVSNFNPATPYSLPPYSMTVFQWPGLLLPPSSTTLTANPTSGAAGQNITLTAAVTSQSGTNTPTGTVSFLDGATTLGTATLDDNGTATFNTAALPAGTDSIIASYGGDANDAGSTSSPVTVTLISDAVPTTTSLTAAPPTTSTGQTVTLTATVAPQSGTTIPAGIVTFLNGTTVLGTASLNNGVATWNTTVLPAGVDPLSASYAGNSADAASVSSTVTVNVSQTVTPTTTTLVASASQTTLGQNVAFTAEVLPQSGTAPPAGIVTFLNGTNILGTATLNSSGTASFSTTTLPMGLNSITVSYGGSSSNSASVSSAVTVTVSQGAMATTTTLAASSMAINTGQSLTLTATVAPQSGTATPTGTVTFLNGGAILGTRPLSDGVATFSTTSLPAGTDSITASYGGSTANSASTSAPVVVTVTQTIVATATTLVASATQITAGQNLSLTATVAPQSGKAKPSGTITFLDGSTVLGTAPLSGGSASFSTSGLTAGTHTITASYGGSANNSASTSAPVTITVASALVQTTTTLTSSATAINTGQSVTFTATVTPKTGGGSVPILPVAFLNGSTILGTANVNANGIATFTTTALPAGADTITASYTGNNSDLSSVSAPVVVTVTQIATTTSLTASAAQLTAGQGVTFTATVVLQSGMTTPHGTVTFFDGTTVLGSSQLNASTAFFSTSSLTVGSHSITAAYGGSASDAKSVSAPVNIIVAQGITPTKTTLTASATQVSYDDNVTLTAIVAPQSGNTAPAGAVAFLDGATILATEPLNAGGVAIFNTRSLATGTHSLTASYEGSNNNSSSISSPVIITVTAPEGPGTTDTTTFLTASSTQLTYSQNVTFTAVVVPEFSGGIPTGSVTFLDGSANLGVVPLDFNGAASLSTSSLSVGTHGITAVYSGSGLENGSASGSVAVIVSAAPPPAPPSAPVPAATATALTSSASQVTAGDPVSLSAKVTASAGGGTPAGTVQFLDGQTLLGSGTLNANGTAILSVTTLAVGGHSIVASYIGDSADAPSSSAAVNVTVAPAGTPGYTMAVSSSAVVVTQGQVANLTVTLTPENGFHMPVNLACSGLPAGMSCSFSPPTVTPDGAPVSSTLSILAAAPAGTSTTSQNRAPRSSSPAGKLAFGLVMPWGIFSLLGLSSRKKRSRAVAWPLRLIVVAVLIAGSLWMSGCGYSVNGSVFTMTLTSSGPNVPTHTSQIVVNVTP